TPARPEPRTPVASRPATQPVQQSIQTGAIDTPGWDGRYALQSGDSLYAIARRHGTTLADLQRVNGISDPTKVRAGTVLHVPGGGAAAGAEPVAERAPEPAQSRTPAATNLGPRVIQIPESGATGESKVASRGDTATDASPETGTAKFRWPVTGGRMI